MAKKKKTRKARRALGQTDVVTYDYTRPSKVVGLSTAGKWTFGLIGAGLLAWLLWPKEAKAETPAEKAIPTNTDAPAAAGSTKSFKDPGSAVTILGNSSRLATGTKYVVKAGDAGWSNIASRAYGDYRWWPALWDANRNGAKFQNPDLLRVGDEIVIPMLPVTDAAFKAAVFARAEADRAWQLARAKARAAKKVFATPRPASIMVPTPVSTKMLTTGSDKVVNESVTPSATKTDSPNINAGSGTTASTAQSTSPTTMQDDMNNLEAEMKSELRR